MLNIRTDWGYCWYAQWRNWSYTHGSLLTINGHATRIREILSYVRHYTGTDTAWFGATLQYTTHHLSLSDHNVTMDWSECLPIQPLRRQMMAWEM